jgi:hypothetical protein
MALAQPGYPPDETPGRALTLRLDPLRNLADIIVLGFAMAYLGYMGLAEVLIFGWINNSVVSNNFWLFIPMVLGLLIAAGRRFRGVRLIIGEDEVQAIGFWGGRKRCRLEDLTEVTEEGGPFTRFLYFRTKDGVAFIVGRNVWTGMQLRTLENLLGVPVADADDSVPSPLRPWAAVLVYGLDALLLAAGAALLVSAHNADDTAHAYQNTTANCADAPLAVGGCNSIVTVTVEAIGEQSGDLYPLSIAIDGDTYRENVVMTVADRAKIYVGTVTGAEIWRGHLTRIRITDKNWPRTTEDPFYWQQAVRTGRPMLLLVVLALIPLVRRLQPLVR